MSEREPLTAVIITQDEPFVVPLLLDELLGAKRDRIAAVFVAEDPLAEGLLATIRRWGSVFDPPSFIRYGLRYVGAKLSGAGPARVARSHEVPAEEVADINAPEFLERLRRIGADLVISVSSPQIFRAELLTLPPMGCVNVHAGPLPRYRGMLPTFWVLYEGEPETAVTVHLMNEKLDDGPILLQEAVPIREGETQASLMRRCKIVGARLLSRAIDLLEAGEPQTRPNPRAEATYYSFPTPEQARQFRAAGGRWM
ncbi:MAG: methionyl-tRNA formyltransferase [Armatimonadota bacterium]|jgi:methionyl-tRNA formyltransferase